MQAFARLSAVYGGTYMLSKPDAKVAYENGVAVGVTAEGETARARLIVGDPSYFPDKVQKASRVREPDMALLQMQDQALCSPSANYAC